MPENNSQTNDFDDVLLMMDETGELNAVENGEVGIKNQTIKDQTPAKQITSLMDTGKEEPALQPPPPAIRKKTASFYFHPDDEEEVAKTLPPQNLQPQKQYSLDKILEKIIVNFHLTQDTDLKKRLRTIIYTYLRDTRSFVDTQEALKRSKADGGLEIASELCDKVMNFLKEVQVKIFQEKGLVIDEKVKKEEESVKAPSIIPTAPPVKDSPIATKDSATPLGLKDIISKSQTIKSEVKEPVQEPVKPQVVSSSPVQTPKDIQEPVKVASRSKRPLKKGKVAMDDIQKDYKLAGPVEELASLSLQTFRRLGSTTPKQVQKVINKVDLLGKESLPRKASGIQGWRRSPLYKMYLAIGQASMEHGLSVEKIIEQYSSQGKEIMTLAEFEAISDLNKQFRF